MKFFLVNLAVFFTFCAYGASNMTPSELRLELLIRHDNGEVTVKSHSFKPGEPVELIVGSMLSGQLLHGVSFKATTTLTDKNEYLVKSTFVRREDGKEIQRDEQHLPLALNQWLHERLGVELEKFPFSFRIVPSL